VTSPGNFIKLKETIDYKDQLFQRWVKSYPFCWNQLLIIKYIDVFIVVQLIY